MISITFYTHHKLNEVNDLQQIETEDDPALEAIACENAYQILQNELAKVVVGQRGVLEQILIALFARSHAILVGVPGLAKTRMVSALAQSLAMTFKRVQFTPDLMPSDIIGSEVIRSDPTTGDKSLCFIPGPIFSHIFLADEINRTSPKTQAAMLEAMQERQVTVGGQTYALPDQFFVLATQNPYDHEGTYPLPEAQLDRFMFMIQVNYPSVDDELKIMRMSTGTPPEQPSPVLSGEQILKIQEIVQKIPVSEHVYRYAQRIVGCSRPKEEFSLPICSKFVNLGAGPRASVNLIKAAKAHAITQGQFYLSCENVAAVAPGILRHRLSLNFAAGREGVSPDDIVRTILEEIPKN